MILPRKWTAAAVAEAIADRLRPGTGGEAERVGSFASGLVVLVMRDSTAWFAQVRPVATDDEELSALAEGAVTSERRTDLLAYLAIAGDDYIAFTDSAQVVAALGREDAAASARGHVPPPGASNAATRLLWAAVLAAVGLILALGLMSLAL